MSFPRVQRTGEFWEAVRTPGEARERQFPQVQRIPAFFDAAEMGLDPRGSHGKAIPTGATHPINI